MLRLLKNVASGAALGISLIACSDNEPAIFYDGSGLLAVSLSIDPVMIEGVPMVAPSPSEFALTLEAPSGAAHTWHSFDDFSQNQRYLSGPYTLTATRGSYLDEGFGAEFYKGSASFDVEEGQLTQILLPVTLQSALVKVDFAPELESAFPDARILVQAEGGLPVKFAPGETRYGALRPGSAYASVALDGADLMFLMPKRFSLAAAQPYIFTTTYSPDRQLLTISDGINRQSSIELSAEAIASPPPHVSLIGADAAQPLVAIERTALSSPVRFEIEDAASASLNINSELLASQGAPASVNLIAPDANEAAWLNSHGVLVSQTGNRLSVDVTDLPLHIDYQPTKASNITQLSVAATNRYNRLQLSPRLEIHISAATVQVMEVSPAAMANNQSTITLRSHLSLDQLREGLSVSAADGSEVSILDIQPGCEPDTYLLTVEVSPGTSVVPLQISYSGEPVASAEIPRGVPEYDIEVDPFAQRAMLKISSPSSALTAYIASHAKVMVGSAPAHIQARRPAQGLIEIIGLSPTTTYTLTTTILTNQPEERPRQATFTTEKAPQLPNSDFEEAKDRIDWQNLPAGGRYSQTQVAVYSQQNHASYKLKAPEKWANTNPKTFYTLAENPNTWYMQPSVWTTETPASGDRAVRLVSTAFDPAGPEIAPYRQQNSPFTPYSRNIPSIAYRAAGKLFLGSYSYSGATNESYEEGIDFPSRPTSLNGWYRYTPSPDDPNDTGVAIIEVLGQTPDGLQVIASGRAILPLATDYTAFSAPLDYSGHFAVKASKIRVMIASSADIGDIPFESTHVITHDDPASSTSIGSVLDLDNLTLAY